MLSYMTSLPIHLIMNERVNHIKIFIFPSFTSSIHYLLFQPRRKNLATKNDIFIF